MSTDSTNSTNGSAPYSPAESITTQQAISCTAATSCAANRPRRAARPLILHVSIIALVAVVVFLRWSGIDDVVGSVLALGVFVAGGVVQIWSGWRLQQSLIGAAGLSARDRRQLYVGRTVLVLFVLGVAVLSVIGGGDGSYASRMPQFLLTWFLASIIWAGLDYSITQRERKRTNTTH